MCEEKRRLGRRRNVGETVMHCYSCDVEVDTPNARGGDPGLPPGWSSIVQVMYDPEEDIDSVNADFSGTFCSTQCLVSHIVGASHTQRLQGTPFVQDVVRETREMQATRIGLIVLDIISAITHSDTQDYGALIPLTSDYEALSRDFGLTVMPLSEEDLPEAFQTRGDNDVEEA